MNNLAMHFDVNKGNIKPIKNPRDYITSKKKLSGYDRS